MLYKATPRIFQCWIWKKNIGNDWGEQVLFFPHIYFQRNVKHNTHWGSFPRGKIHSIIICPAVELLNKISHGPLQMEKAWHSNQWTGITVIATRKIRWPNCQRFNKKTQRTRTPLCGFSNTVYAWLSLDNRVHILGKVSRNCITQMMAKLLMHLTWCYYMP